MFNFEIPFYARKKSINKKENKSVLKVVVEMRKSWKAVSWNIKKRKEEKPWHYTNIAEGKWTYNAARDCPDRSCVTEQIQKFV